MIQKAGYFLICVGLILLEGCKSNLPTYASLDGPTARQILTQRAAAIHTFSAQCQVTLTRPDGQTVRLDGVMLIAAPDRLRLRVWKFNQPVFDLTLRSDGLWIQTSPEAAARGPVVPASLGAAQLAHFLSWFEGGFFSSPDLTVSSTGDTLTFRLDQQDGMALVCQVDRATATPRMFSLIDRSGKTLFSLAMSDYRDYAGIVWPMHMAALSTAGPDQGGGKIDVEFSSIEFNGDLAPRAFSPPADAQRRQ